jgi:hypothetical protein
MTEESEERSFVAISMTLVILTITVCLIFCDDNPMKSYKCSLICVSLRASISGLFNKGEALLFF